MQRVFQPYRLGNVVLRNRIIKSGIYEGRCDRNGFPLESYVEFYEELARGGVGGIITGFAFISGEGRAMQPFQAGIDHPDKVPYYKEVTRKVHEHGCPVFLQIVHTGRQTRKNVTGMAVRGCSSKKSVYFRERPLPFTTGEIRQKVVEFAEAACLAREAGFDGIQLHGAHGYLIHQFLRNAVNDREDEYGIDINTGLGLEFLKEILLAVKIKCGSEYPVLVKISGEDDLKPPFISDQFSTLIRFLGKMGVHAIEISYGTMDHALNIFRGDMPQRTIMQKNPILNSDNPLQKSFNRLIMNAYFKRKLKPFTPVYNLKYAAAAKEINGTPIISVGGFRSMKDIIPALESESTDLVGMARPLICEPDLIRKMQYDGNYESKCTNCNLCAVMCDTESETRCYQRFKS